MSKEADILDAFVTKIQTVLPSHTRLTDPYNLDQNNDLNMEQAFGVAIGGGENLKQMISCKLGMQRNIIVSIVRKYFAPEFDIDAKDAADENLLDDKFSVVKDFEDENTLDGLVTSAEYENDGGIIFIRGNEPFKAIELNFSVRYFDNLN